ncbi:MAG TPA: MFS transporter [Polyangia bacterium]|jgi:MFS family permease|nr:MFS transporter [Polyangia bacterium]
MTDAPSPRPAKTLRAIGRALRHRNYRLFFVGQGTSLVGTWLTRVATSWLVYRLTGSALLLGVVGFAGQIPTFFLAPVAGVWVDRWNRHRVLVVTQVLAMIQSALLAALAFSGRMTVTAIAALSVFQALINAFDMPARQAFLVQMVTDRGDLPNAIALNSSMVNAARLIGPSVAGILIGLFGEGWCFAIDAVSYLAVIGSLLAMRIEPRPAVPRTTHATAELLEGFRYVVGHFPIRSVLLLLAVVSLMGMPYTVLMPVVASSVLHGGAHTLGFLMAASGAGALAGALYLASRTSVVGLGRVIGLSAAMFGVSLIAFALSRWMWLSLALMVPTGLGMMVQMAASNTVVQTLVDEDKRGRVMSFFAMAFFGTVPFGSLLAGSLAQRIGSPETIGLGGIVCVVGAALFFRALPELRRHARPVYQRLGILPEVAAGLQSASRPPITPED